MRTFPTNEITKTFNFILLYEYISTMLYQISPKSTINKTSPPMYEWHFDSDQYMHGIPVIVIVPWGYITMQRAVILELQFPLSLIHVMLLLMYYSLLQVPVMTALCVKLVWKGIQCFRPLTEYGRYDGL